MSKFVYMVNIPMIRFVSYVPEWNIRTFLFTKYAGDQIKKKEMGEACGTCVRKERFIQGFGGAT